MEKYTIKYSLKNTVNNNITSHTIDGLYKFTVYHVIETLKNFFKYNPYDKLTISVYEEFAKVNNSTGVLLDCAYEYKKDSPGSFNIMEV